MHEPDGYPPANDDVLAAARGAGWPARPVLPREPARRPGRRGRALPGRRRPGDQAPPARRAVHARPPEVRALVALAHERCAAGPDPRRPRDPGARPARGRARRGVPGRAADPRPRRDLRPVAGSGASPPTTRTCCSTPPGGCPADLQALFSLVPPGQILFASDAPYGTTAMSAAFQLRSALQVGLSPDQIRSIASEQSLRIAAGEPLEPAGPAVGERERPRTCCSTAWRSFVMLGAIATMRGVDAGRDARARPARLRRTRRDRRRARVRGDPRAARRLRRSDAAEHPDDRRRIAFLILAATVARTPDVPIPESVAQSVDCAPRSASARSA